MNIDWFPSNRGLNFFVIIRNKNVGQMGAFEGYNTFSIEVQRFTTKSTF